MTFMLPSQLAGQTKGHLTSAAPPRVQMGVHRTVASVMDVTLSERGSGSSASSILKVGGCAGRRRIIVRRDVQVQFCGASANLRAPPRPGSLLRWP